MFPGNNAESGRIISGFGRRLTASVMSACQHTESVFMENFFLRSVARSMCLMANSFPSVSDLPRNTCARVTRTSRVRRYKVDKIPHNEPLPTNYSPGNSRYLLRDSNTNLAKRSLAKLVEQNVVVDDRLERFGFSPPSHSRNLHLSSEHRLNNPATSSGECQRRPA